MSNTSNTSTPICLYVNHSLEKTKFDRIAIYKRNDGKFTVYFKSDCTNETVKDKRPTVRLMETHHDLLDYVEDFMDLLMNDVDTPGFANIDVAIPCMPVVALHPKNYAVKSVLLRSIRSWAK
jgi:hypothetical protein